MKEQVYALDHGDDLLAVGFFQVLDIGQVGDRASAGLDPITEAGYAAVVEPRSGDVQRADIKGAIAHFDDLGTGQKDSCIWARSLEASSASGP